MFNCKGKYVGKKYTYEGDFVDNSIHGKGKYWLPNG